MGYIIAVFDNRSTIDAFEKWVIRRTNTDGIRVSTPGTFIISSTKNAISELSRFVSYCNSNGINHTHRMTITERQLPMVPYQPCGDYTGYLSRWVPVKGCKVICDDGIIMIDWTVMHIDIRMPTGIAKIVWDPHFGNMFVFNDDVVNCLPKTVKTLEKANESIGTLLSQSSVSNLVGVNMGYEFVQYQNAN